VASVRLAAGEAPRFTLTPDPSLDGLHVAAVGGNVFAVAQESRLAALSSPPPAGQKPPAVAGPLTPTVRATVERPALVSAYLVSSGDGSIGALLAWGAKLAEAKLAESMRALPPWLAATSRRLPLLMAVSGVESLLLYDVALSLDVSGSVLVFEVASSEL
jgi:hypothetical protein